MLNAGPTGTTNDQITMVSPQFLMKFIFKGIHWLFYKLGLKVAFSLDKNDGICHFAELGSCCPGALKTSPKIALPKITYTIVFV